MQYILWVFGCKFQSYLLIKNIFQTDDDHDSGTESDDEFQDGTGITDEPSSRECNYIIFNSVGLAPHYMRRLKGIIYSK